MDFLSGSPTAALHHTAVPPSHPALRKMESEHKIKSQ